ncbi:MAG TPA: hypothetical protein DCL41_04225 [Bdellovibrionales bacterium]|nr:hypothetical protein [Pseudobdellovibrionaceae bacterium]HAG91051.1 hypothetical protein [Bdellovibrionales bacterium]|tara:strand:+ start:58 stop:1101 length:1044 start_codon:yes stop_codon:yes gene_type:complete
MRQWNFLISILTLGCSFASVSMAQEQLGTLSVSDLTLRPQGFYREQQEGEFVLGESSVGILWTLDDRLSSKFRIGAHSLRGKPKLYADTKSESDIDLVEAYGEYESLFGRFRIGLIPLEIGREGVLSESELIFPRSEIYSQGLVGLRDIGLNYFITYNYFFTGFSVFNGESGNSQDHKTWYAARWGYDFHKLRVEAFGQTGSTDPSSTTGSSLTVARFNAAQTSKWRMGGVYADWRPSSFRLSLDFAVGDKEQNQESFRFATSNLEFGQMFSEGLGYFVRYNPFDPDLKTDNDGVHKVSLALVKANKSSTSKVILIGSKVMEEGVQTPNDEIRLIWSVTPLYFPQSN